MRRVGLGLGICLAAGLLAGGIVTAPRPLPADAYAGLSGDATRGAQVFAAAGCASCHVAPGDAVTETPVLAGGKRFVTAFGTFVAPNISPHRAAGIGGWTLADLGNAIQRGVSPDGAHYYPALPYAAYARMVPQDVADLYAHLMTLPADATPSLPQEVAFPFSLRRGLGLWKALNLSDDWVMPDGADADVVRGRYLVEALAHCGECHSPRGLTGGLDRDRWLQGAPNLEGTGRIPDITPAALTWTEAEIADYLGTGFTPDYDSAGGAMAQVVENLARLPAADRLAIARYLKRIPARP